jgi:tetratricopeptide (TPR) repeat protein
MIDDPFLLRAVERDPALSLKALKSDLTDNVHKEAGTFYYRPVLSAMVRLEYFFWGRNPAGYHVVSLLFHIANAILVLALLTLLGFEPYISLVTACLFAVNPVIVDDLLAATGGESMANFFLFASLLLYLNKKPAWAWLLSFPALFAKESNIMLPALLLLCLAYQGRFRKEYGKVLALLPGCGLFLLMRHRYVVSPADITVFSTLKFMVADFPQIIFHYLRVLLVPWALETWPPMPPMPHFWFLILAVGAAVLAGLFLLPVRRRITAFCAAWFFLMMAPRIPAIMHNQVLMDKWVFMASPAVFVLLLVLAAKVWDHPSPYLRALPRGAVAVMILFWATLAQANVKLRGTDEGNYRWTIRNGPRGFASYRLGVILLREGRVDEAVQVLQPLPALYPDDPDYQNAYTMALWHSGKHEAARVLMKDLEKRYPDSAEIKENAAEMRASR